MDEQCLESKVNLNTQRIEFVEGNSKSWWQQLQMARLVQSAQVYKSK